MGDCLGVFHVLSRIPRHNLSSLQKRHRAADGFGPSAPRDWLVENPVADYRSQPFASGAVASLERLPTAYPGAIGPLIKSQLGDLGFRFSRYVLRVFQLCRQALHLNRGGEHAVLFVGTKARYGSWQGAQQLTIVSAARPAITNALRIGASYFVSTGSSDKLMTRWP